MNHKLQISLLALLLALAGIPGQRALGQEVGDRQQGRALARQLCSDCHAVGRRNLHSRNSQAPAFVAIASTPGMTAMALNVFFQTPHREMPNLILTSEQKRNVSAYILSLKR